MIVYTLSKEEMLQHAAFVFEWTLRELVRFGELDNADAERISASYVPLYAEKTLFGRAWELLWGSDEPKGLIFRLARLTTQEHVNQQEK